MPATGLKIVWTWACLTWCSISSSFQSSLKMSGHRGYEFLEFWCWNLVPFLPDIGLEMSMTESCRWVMQCRLRARRPQTSNEYLWPCPLCTAISPVSLNLLMMLCTVDDDIGKAFEIWRWGTLFLNYFTIILQVGEPLPIFTSERLCLSKTSLLYLIRLQTWYQLT